MLIRTSGAGKKIQALIAALNRGSLCPVIGAGASMQLGLPSWTNLALDVVMPELKLGAPKRGLAKRVLPAGDPTQVLELVDDSKVFSRLRKALYVKKIRRSDWTEKASSSVFDDSALKLLAQLCIWVAHVTPERAFHVITYNYDTLLEEAVSCQGHNAETLTVSGKPFTMEVSCRRPLLWYEPAEFHPYTRRSAFKPLTVRVAHAHGVVFRESEPKSEQRPDVVLTGADYDTSISTVFAKHNLWQMAAFSSLDCLFYGWSFSDYAVRRLLRMGSEISKLTDIDGASTRHVALLKRDVADANAKRKYDEVNQKPLGKIQVEALFVNDFKVQQTFLEILLRQAEGEQQLSGEDAENLDDQP